MAQDEDKQDSQKPKKKVAKTLLFNTANLTDILPENQTAPVDADPAEVATEAPTEASPEASAEPPAASEEQGAGKKKRVAKTLIFDPTSAIEKAAIQESAMQEAAMQQAASVEPSISEQEKSNQEKLEKEKLAKEMDEAKMAAVQDVVMAAAVAQEEEAARKKKAARITDSDAPMLNIDSPEVKLFFEKEAEETAQATPPDVVPPEAVQEAVQEESKPKRKVPRTMLYTPIPEAARAMDVTIAPSAALPATAINDQPVRRISTKKIAKTLVFDNDSPAEESLYSESLSPSPSEAPNMAPQADIPSGEAHQLAPDYSAETAQIAESEPAAPAAPKKKFKAQQYVAKTMLDHSLLFDQVSKVQHKAEEKAIEVAREKAHEPFKPFFQVEAKKKALGCNWTWDTTYATERYKYCANCQHAVYNMHGLEQADADDLVYKVENLEKYTLFERPDGLFMTSNCPVAVKRRSDTVLISIGAILAVACVLVFMASLPKPKPKPVEANEDAAPVKFVRTASKDAQGRTVYTTTAVKDTSAAKETRGLKPVLAPTGGKPMQPGSGHYDAASGQFVEDVPAERPAPPPVANTSSQNDPDTDWEFSSPQK